MSVYDAAFVNTELAKPTSIFGLRLWVVIGILVGSLIVIALFLISICVTSRHRSRAAKKRRKMAKASPAAVSKEIQEVAAVHHHHPPSEIQVELGKAEHRVVVFSDRFGFGRRVGQNRVGLRKREREERK